MKVRCLFLLLLPALSASAETYKIDTDHSQIAFTIHQFVGTVRVISIDLAARLRWTASIRKDRR